MSNYLLYTQTDASTTGNTLNEQLLAEDVAPFVSNLFPLATPIQNWLQTESMSSVFKQFPVDSFGNISRTTSMFGPAATTPTVFTKPEGYTPTTSTPEYKAKIKGVAEIHLEAFGVSGTMRRANLHGIADLFVDEAEKVTKKVVNDFEWAFTWSPGTNEGGTDWDSSGGGEVHVARQTQGLAHWIMKTGLQRGTASINSNYAVPTVGLTDGNGNVFGSSSGNVPLATMSYCKDAAGVALDRDSFFELMLRWSVIGGQPDGCVVMASSQVKRLFSTFAHTAVGAVNERKVEAAGKMIYDTVDAYETDFGLHFLNRSIYLDQPSLTQTVTMSTGSTVVNLDRCLFAFMPQGYRIGVFRGVGFEALGKTGDHTQGQILGEQGILCANTLHGCGIVNCVTP